MLSICLPASLALLNGCVSVDPRALRETPDIVATKNLRAVYLNEADYQSKGEFMANATLAEALGIHQARLSAWAYVWRVSDQEVLVRFISQGVTIAERRYLAGDGLRILPDQRIELKKPGECGGRDSPGFGCSTGTVTLFVNGSGELVAIESGGGAGLIGVIPFALYAKLVSTHHWISNRPQPDEP